MKTHWNKTPTGLEPADAETEDWLSRKKTGAYIEATTSEPRNGAHHRLFFALVGLVFDNQDTCQDKDQFLAALKIGAGHATQAHVKLNSGQVVATFMPKSIAFAKMDQGEFSAFYDKVLDVVIRDYWPGMTKPEIKAEVAEIVGIGSLMGNPGSTP